MTHEHIRGNKDNRLQQTGTIELKYGFKRNDGKGVKHRIGCRDCAQKCHFSGFLIRIHKGVKH
jgi:hypothetical protein